MKTAKAAPVAKASLKRYYLIAYDIACKKRLGQTHRYLKSRGIAVQYSVFLVKEDQAGAARLMNELKARLDPAVDDLRAYPCEGRSAMWLAGRGTDTWLQPVELRPPLPPETQRPKRSGLLGWLFR